MVQQTGEDSRGNDNKILIALEKGQIKISGETADGQKGALLKPGRGVSLTVNGRGVTDKREVFPGDVINISTNEEIIPEQVEVKLSADGMTAEARYLPGIKKFYILPDHPYTDDLLVEGVSHEENITTYSEEDVKRSLVENQIRFGLDEEAASFLLEEQNSWHVVAKGKPVEQGQDGRVELLFEGGFKSVKYEDKDEKVDFRKRYEIEQVSEGDEIAIIHPPIQGVTGQKVTGEEIQPDPVKRIEANCESGTAFSNDGSRVVATRKGIPSYKKGRLHSFRVDDLYTHKGDVDIKSGNIHFRGHFKVQGDVTEGMKVAADGNIEIGGNASGAEVLAGGSIIFKANCIKCKVQAGWVDLVLKDVYRVLNQMSESIDDAIEASEELVRALEQKGKYSEKMEAAVVRALLQSKFVELPEYAAELQKSLKSVGKSMPEEITKTIVEVTPHFIDFQYSQSLGRPVLVEIKEKLDVIKDSSKEVVEKADITAPYIQNSSLLCTGDILVPGSGVYNSQLKCNGMVKVDKLFRGGVIESGGDVYIGEAGTPRITSEQGTIQVSYKGRVHLGSVYENFRLRFGTTEYRFDKNMNNVRLILDQQEFEVKVLHWDR
jgi:hypothetical protein